MKLYRFHQGCLILGATAAIGCSESVDPTAQIDGCEMAQSLELVTIEDYESGKGRWSEPRADHRNPDHAVGKLETVQVEPQPGCPVSGSQAVKFTLRENTRTQDLNTDGGGDRGQGFDGYAFYARAEGDQWVGVQLDNWQTHNQIPVPADVNLADDPLALQRQNGAYMPCGYDWRDSDRDGVPEEGECCEDLDGDKIPEEIPIKQQCGDHWRGTLKFTSEWSFIKLPFSSLRQQGRGRVYDELDQRGLATLKLRVPEFAGMELYIDWFGFYKDAPPPQ